MTFGWSLRKYLLNMPATFVRGFDGVLALRYVHAKENATPWTKKAGSNVSLHN